AHRHPETPRFSGALAKRGEWGPPLPAHADALRATPPLRRRVPARAPGHRPAGQPFALAAGGPDARDVARLSDAPRAARTMRLAVALSLALFALRLHTASGLGFGDAEALYACYAMHPQPAYLDHPGFIGFLLRLIGSGSAPDAAVAHSVSALSATLVPWLAALAARASGLPWERAATAVLGLALVPELSIGLFGVSPDLPLAFCWLGALALVAYLCRLRLEHTGSTRALLCRLGLGLVLGLGVLSKLSAVLLVAALFIASLSRGQRRVWLSYGPWLSVACMAILVTPLCLWEHRTGFSMLEHRLVATQADAGVSLANLLKLLVGQLLYVTPPYLVAAWLVARDLFARRSEDALSRVLWFSFAFPLLALALLSIWSNRAEPHWVAPPLLALGIHVARFDLVSRRLAQLCLATGAVLALLVWASVKTDAYVTLASSPVLKPLGGYQARYDLTNDLYAWGPGGDLLRQALSDVTQATGTEPVVVGAPHWMICAQAH